jgi:hypothetical protein
LTPVFVARSALNFRLQLLVASLYCCNKLIGL